MYGAIISFLLNCAPQRMYVFIMSRTRFRVNPHYSWLNVKEFLTRSRHKIWTLSNCNWTRTHNHLVRKRTLNHLAKLASCSHLNFRFCACFEQGFLWHPATIECGFTLKRVRGMTRTYSLHKRVLNCTNDIKSRKALHMNVFIWRKDNALLSRYIDFCISVKSTDFKICDVIISIAA